MVRRIPAHPELEKGATVDPAWFLPPVNEPATIIQCKGPLLDSAPDEIQLFPPGRHVITPTIPGEEKTFPIAVEVNESTAAALQADLERYLAQAKANEGDAPYLDLNHEDREASAWPKEIFWGGDDPITGGVRARVVWTKAGTDAIEGKLFRRISPQFMLDRKPAPPAQEGAVEEYRITGAPVNFGGLVNRAAFRVIAPLFAAAKDAADPNVANANQQENATNPTMNEEQIAALKAENDELKAKLAELLKEKEEAAAAAMKTEAETAVEAAAKEGRIPPANTELRASLVKSYIADPDATKIVLAGLPVNAALAPATVQARAGEEEKKEEPARGFQGLVASIKAKNAEAAANVVK